MILTSTLLKVDLAVLSVLLGIIVVFRGYIREVQQETAKSAGERAEIRQNIDFCGKRLDNIENWRASISEIRKGQ